MSVSTNDKLMRASVRHAVYLNRFAGQVKNEAVEFLRDAQDDLIEQITKRSSRSIIAGQGKEARRLKPILDSLKEVNTAIHGELREKMAENLNELAGHEIKHQIKVLEDVVPIQLGYTVPAEVQVIAAINAKPFEGQTLRQWSKELEPKAFDAMQRQIRIGFVQGETMPQIIERLLGSDDLNFRNSVFKKIERNVSAIARTSVNHVSNTAREETYKANEEFMKGVQWVSTLDGDTSPICQDLDGNVFELGKGPRPPAHIGCRSTTVPIMKSFRELGFDIDELPASTRASMNGQVAEETTYNDFLKGELDKNFKFVEGVLGKTKAKLFRDGGMTVNDFVDDFGKPFTINELRIADASAFERAGL